MNVIQRLAKDRLCSLTVSRAGLILVLILIFILILIWCILLSRVSLLFCVILGNWMYVCCGPLQLSKVFQIGGSWQVSQLPKILIYLSQYFLDTIYVSGWFPLSTRIQYLLKMRHGSRLCTAARNILVQCRVSFVTKQYFHVLSARQHAAFATDHNEFATSENVLFLASAFPLWTKRILTVVFPRYPTSLPFLWYAPTANRILFFGMAMKKCLRRWVTVLPIFGSPSSVRWMALAFLLPLFLWEYYPVLAQSMYV